MDDGKEVIFEFSFWTKFLFIFNDEIGSVMVKQPGEVFPSNPTEPVSVGNHNFVDVPRHDLNQHFVESLPFEIDPTGNVFDNFMVRVFFLEVGDLPFKILFLFVAGDPAVEEVLFVRIILPDTVSFFFLTFNELLDVVQPVSFTNSGVLDFPRVRPPSKGDVGDSKFFSSLVCSDIHDINISISSL